MEPLEVCKLSKETASSPRVAVTHRPIENKTKFPPFSTHRSLMSVRAGASIVTVVDPPEDGDAFSEFITHNGGGDRIKVVGKPGNFATRKTSECGKVYHASGCTVFPASSQVYRLEARYSLPDARYTGIPARSKV